MRARKKSAESKKPSLHELESRINPSLTMLGDLNLNGMGASIGDITPVGNIVYFTADDGIHGRELWKSDGTKEGTVLVKDINPGAGGSKPSELTVVNGNLFFTTNSLSRWDSAELWKTDGSPAGTFQLNTNGQFFQPSQLVNFRGELFFKAGINNDLVNLMKSDGTLQGTRLIKKLGSIREIVATPTILFFSSTESNDTGDELWKSDGTSEGTILVKDIFEGTISDKDNPNWFSWASSEPTNITPFGNIVYFTATDRDHGRELWKSDGTENGTVIVKDIAPGLLDSSPSELIVTENGLFFSADNGVNGRELWKTSDTSGSSSLVRDICPGVSGSDPKSLTLVNGTLFFSADDGSSGRELWKTDGYSQSTFLVKDINPGWVSGSSPAELVNVGGTLFFTADNGKIGRELWKTDGSASGTSLVKDIRLGQADANIHGLVNANGLLFFVADDGVHGAELWKSNSAIIGTILIGEINTAPGNFNPKEFTRVGNTVYFTADDGVNGRELWKTDGTAEGTALVRDIYPASASSSPHDLMEFNGELFFIAKNPEYGSGIWKSDGSLDGTFPIKSSPGGASTFYPMSLSKSNEKLIFYGMDQGLGKTAIWKSDGTSAGTVPIIDFTYSGVLYNPPTDFGKQFFFQLDDGYHGIEFWVSDGSFEGTKLLKDIAVWQGMSWSGSFPNSFGLIGTSLIFSARNSSTGEELWKSDGSESGTVLLKDINTNGTNFSSSPEFLISHQGVIFFTALDDSGKRNLWRTDGTGVGTFFIKSLNLEATIKADLFDKGESVSASLENCFLFAADDGLTGSELWASDGTSFGTKLVKDLSLKASGSTPSFFTSLKQNVYFTADDGVNGRELWVTDGTGNGTRLVQDLFPGERGSNPQWLSATDNHLFFSATDPVHGTELWAYSLDSAPAITSSNKVTFTAGQAGNHFFTASGFPLPQFSLVTGVLPAGLALNTDGILSGVPASDSGGTYTFTVQASNGIGSNALQSFTLTVNQAPVITSTGKASFMVNKAGAFAVTANGYPAPAFSVSTGNLPGGLSLTSDGKLQGTPQTGSLGSYTFQIKAANAGGTSFQTFTATVNGEGVFSVAAMGGGRDFSKLAIYKNGTKELLREVIPFPGFKGEFYVDSGDISGDGVEDIIVGSGNGSQNGHVVVFDGAVLMNPNTGKVVELPYSLGGSVRASLYAFVGYSSGVAVRLADMNDDGFDDMVLAPGTGAGTKTPAHLRVWNGKDCMADFEAGKPLPYDYRWEMSSFWAFGEGSNPGGGMALSVIRQAGPDLIIASQLFRGGSKVFRYDSQKVLTTVVDLTGWQDLLLTGNTVVGFDREGNRFFANGGTDKSSLDTVFVRDKDKKAAYTIDKIFGGTPGGLRLGLANMDADAEDELLVIRGIDSTTKVYDLFADKAVLVQTLLPGGVSGWV